MANTSRSQREAARRAKVVELQREQRAKERRRTLTVIAILAVIIAIVIALVAYSLITSRSSSGSQIVPSTPSGPPTVQQPPAKVTNTTGVKGVVAYDTKGYPAPGSSGAGTLTHEHVTGPVTYAVVPPVGGPHSDVWMNAGVYTEPIPPERAIHNLEHGAVWITYRPGLPAAQVKALTAFVGKQTLIDESAATAIAGQSNRFVDLSPWSDAKLPSPIVISAWGYQLYVDTPTDPRLQQFVDTFRHSQTYSPEYGSAMDGEPVQTGGRAAEFGATKPNPAGAVPNQ